MGSRDRTAEGQDAPLPRLKRVITRKMIAHYAALIDGPVRNPIHYDVAFAREAGFSDVLAHGASTLGLVSEALTGLLGPAWLSESRLSAKLIGPVIAGDEVRVYCRVRESSPEDTGVRVTVDFWCETQARLKVVVGSATAVVDDWPTVPSSGQAVP